ncbi:MAG: methylated-DNA--[protein]-cysteine S-methyltransferase [Janthinobacterium lividum]
MSNFFHSVQDFRNILKDQDIYAGQYLSPYGSVLIHATSGDVLGLYFTHCGEEIIKINSHFCKKHDLKKFTQNDTLIHDWGQKIFIHKDQKVSFKISGTDFQINVWQQLLNIFSGQTMTYGQIALAINQPKAVRAVGTAIAANPLSFIIPCHRILRGNGDLGGYRWGSDLKQTLLNNETGI